MRKNNAIKTIRIVVGGTGMIPRLNQIAPIKAPFEVSLNDLGLILRTSSLTVKMVSPIDNHTVTINRKNYDGMLKLYTAWLAEKERQDLLAAAEEAERKADAVPMTEEEKKDLEYAKKKGFIPANSSTLTKSEVRDAVNSAFEAIMNEPSKIEPVKSTIKDVSEVLKEKNS